MGDDSRYVPYFVFLGGQWILSSMLAESRRVFGLDFFGCCTQVQGRGAPPSGRRSGGADARTLSRGVWLPRILV